MAITFFKTELLDLYNLMGCTILDYEEGESELSAEVLAAVKIAKDVEEKIATAYQGLRDWDSASLELSAEEALVVVRALTSNIRQHEELVGSEDDPISFNAEWAYLRRNLKERIQKHYRDKFYDLWALSDPS